MKKFGARGDDAGNASGAASPAELAKDPQPAAHVDILKALADPLRLSILYTLTQSRGSELPSMTVKELAAELGEPQTKLYRHIKHLESAGLIRSGSSRVVSGIVEQRYQASRGEIMGDDLTDAEKVSPEAEAIAAAALDLYRRQYFTTRRARPPDKAADEAEPHRRMVMAMVDGMVPASRAAAIYRQLYQLFGEVAEARRGRATHSAGEKMVPVNLLIGYFSADQPDN